MKRLTREERRQRSRRILMLLTYGCLLLILLIWLVGLLSMTATAEPVPDAILGEDTPATEPCFMTEEEVEAAENEMIEAALLAKATKIENVTVTHYCICEKCCGKSPDHPAYGITASGLMSTPGVSVGVDPDVIPLGSDVLVDYGDGEIHYYRADDTGSGVEGNHIDLCVGSHQEALNMGVRSATVWWVMP